MSNKSDDFLREQRKEWLEENGLSESDIKRDPVDGTEYIFQSGEEGEGRVLLPEDLQWGYY